jgi:hypothetical protein
MLRVCEASILFDCVALQQIFVFGVSRMRCGRCNLFGCMTCTQIEWYSNLLSCVGDVLIVVDDMLWY